MKKLVLLFALIFTVSLVGCSSDNSLVSSDVDNSINQAPGTPTAPPPGDPSGMGDGNNDPEGDPTGMGDGNNGPSGP